MDKDAADVRLNKYNRLVKGKGADSSGCGSADAGQGLEDLDCPRDPAAVVINNDGGQSFESQGPAVIAQPLPSFEDGTQGGAGHGLDRGEAAEKLPIFLNNPLDLGLLQHQLRQEDLIWIVRPSPGEHPLVLAIVGIDPLLKQSYPLGAELDGSLHILFRQHYIMEGRRKTSRGKDWKKFCIGVILKKVRTEVHRGRKYAYLRISLHEMR